MKKKTKTEYIQRNLAFEKICQMTQEDVKEYVTKRLLSSGRKVYPGDGFVYSPGTVPVLVCAHMDTVHRELPSKIFYSHDGDTVSSPMGIGGDDRCGIYMIFEIIKELNCHVAFFESEEIGGVGSKKFAKTQICENLGKEINYVIELDRMNANDAVFYYCDNPEFTEFVTESFWKEGFGSFTDISTICPEMGVAGVNLSCGYYKQHTIDEYVVFSEMERAIKETINLIKRSPNKQFEYIEAEFTSNYPDVYGKYDWNNINSYYYSKSTFKVVFRYDVDVEEGNMDDVWNVEYDAYSMYTARQMFLNEFAGFVSPENVIDVRWVGKAAI